MAAAPGWSNPLDHPLAVAGGGLCLVLLVRGAGLGLPLAIPLALAVGFGLSLLLGRRGAAGRRSRSRSQRLHDQRLDAALDGALARAADLGAVAVGLQEEAIARFTDPGHLEALGSVQLCCERLQQLPQRLQQRRPLLESGGGVRLDPDALARRLAREEKALRKETEGPLRQERRRLSDQLRRNLDAARRGMDEREARLLALATRLEAIDGGLQQLRRLIDRQWPSTEASDAAMATAIEPLDDALDQIERLLDAGAV
ncbi:hypothetical protein [Synechococcus sp. CCY 9618]|uniref:hypothetical protein n=1 Tax=Synechococcus sp. CCY 9618 TaxID=2815602 RepID=UPI001C245717|nr:hypothetical protein [Synechococcus sp. CCY 9618]